MHSLTLSLSHLVSLSLSKCALELSKHSTFLYSQDLDSVTNTCLRALDGSNYTVRCSVVSLLGTLLSLTQKPVHKSLRGRLKLPGLEEALTVLSNGFVRGASGFLKAGGSELLKIGSASRDVRVGITQVGDLVGGWSVNCIRYLCSYVVVTIIVCDYICSECDFRRMLCS